MTFIKTMNIHDLGVGPALALRAFRSMAAGCDHADLVRRFDEVFGFAGRAALGAMHMLVKEIGVAGGRRVAVACPGCCKLTADELSVLALLSAAQERNDPLIEAHAAWLMAGQPAATARAAAIAVSAVFKIAGLTLARPPVEISARPRAHKPVLRVTAGNA
ncbi:MAG: hypothetical protein ACKVS5_14275 [Parvularculaceae bacterium]